MMFEKDVKEIYPLLQEFVGQIWDGKECVKKLKREGSTNWRQTEWQGWYWQHVLKKKLKSVIKIPGLKIGVTEFDGQGRIPWDAKTSRTDETPLNDASSILKAIDKYECIGLIIAKGYAEMDEDGEFKKWHKRFSGGESKHKKKRKSSRKRKKAFIVDKILIIKLDNDCLLATKEFVQGRNSNDKKRPKKLTLCLNKISNNKIFEIK